MACRTEENLNCPVCRDIFNDPVLLSCSHSFCKACWQRWWTEDSTHKCPVCKTTSSSYNPPRNLALRNLCEDFLAVEGDQRRPAALCALHLEDLKLFCLDHRRPVCIICLHSSLHADHSFRPVDEAAADYREGLRQLLKPLQEKLELYNDVKGNFDETAKDLEVQAWDTERQIKDEVSMLQRFLKQEQQERIGAVRQEKKQKSEAMKRRTDALSRDIAALSDTVRATEEVLRAGDLSFLHGCEAAVEVVDRFQLGDPQPIPGGLMDMAKHLDNLPVVILDSIGKKILKPEFVKPKVDPEPPRRRLERPVHQLVHHPTTYQSYAGLTRPLAVAPLIKGLNLARFRPLIPPPPPPPPPRRFSEKQQASVVDDDLYG